MPSRSTSGASSSRRGQASYGALNRRRDRDQVGSSRQSSSHSRTGRNRRREEEQEEEEQQGEENGLEAEDVEDDEEGAGEDEEGAEDGEEEESGGHYSIPKRVKLTETKTAVAAAKALGKDEVRRKSKDLVRLALFDEHRRVAIKREDISRKVLKKEGAKAFPVIFNRAQKILRDSFGFELVEVRARGVENDQILQTHQQGAGPSQEAGKEEERGEEEDTKAKASAGKSYIVRSVLPHELISQMTTPDASLAAAVKDEAGSTGGLQADSSGTMLDWKRSTSELANTGLLFVILSLILLNGRTIADDQLRTYLRRLSLEPSDPLPPVLIPGADDDFNTFGGARSSEMTLDDYMDRLAQNMYLERYKSDTIADASAKRTQVRGKRKNRTSGRDAEEGIAWRWGPRAEAEISEKSVALFIHDIFSSLADEEQENGAGSSTARREMEPQSLITQIERAAGSELIS